MLCYVIHFDQAMVLGLSCGVVPLVPLDKVLKHGNKCTIMLMVLSSLF
jgi:hypothetical protein